MPTDANAQLNPAEDLALESPREADGRWVAQVVDARVVAVAVGEEDAKRAALVLGLRVVADRVERGDSVQDALLAAFAALQDGMDYTAARKVTRVLRALLKVGGELKQRAENLRALTATKGKGTEPEGV